MPIEGTLRVSRVPAGRFDIRLRRTGQRLRIPLFCYIALLPVLALFLYVRIIPIGFGFVLSLYRWNMISPRKPFVGLANYVQLFGDEKFIAALKNTTIYSFATVILTTVLALPLAVFLARRSRFSAFYQTIYFLPVITPLIPMSIAWKWIYDYNYGVLNYLLSLVNLPAVPWLTDPSIALWAVIMMTVWKQLGYAMVLYLVGLRNIPHEYAEAASIDGASDTQRFWRITLPLLRPILLYVLVTSSISSFNVFAQVYVMTVGSQTAPGNALRVLVYDIYTNAFQFLHMGYASAEAVMLTMIVLGLTLIQFRAVRSDTAKEA
jgi:multiple sugar transport system permease protein